VAVITVDGLRPDAITAEHAPSLTRLMTEGMSSAVGQTVMPSLTLPAHTSIFTGLVPQRHGITWNDDDTTIARPLEAVTVFDLLVGTGIRSAVFAAKGKLRVLTRPNAPTYLYLPSGNDAWLSARVVEDVRQFYSSGALKPRFVFIHLPDADFAGHEHGWMSAGYFAGVRKADEAFGKIWQVLREKYGANLVIIVTADHGGLNRGHGDGSVQSMRVPLMFWGADVRQGVMAGTVRVVDVAPTVLTLMRLGVPAGLDGRALTSPFEAAAQAGH
jgi:predicted AlkP superfamily pyrophosphatase or phosphodiesterase